MRGIARALVVAIVLVNISACINPRAVNQYSAGRGWYMVKPSDTLYSIAWRYGLDYRELATWNDISVDSTIYPGQKLLLIKPESGQDKPDSGQAVAENTQALGNQADKPNDSGQNAGEPKFESSDPETWLWPTEGKLLSSFSASKLDRRGIDIGGTLGQPVVAVADGKVVYSGNGLAGYGNLIIIKHSETYLSAYAYSRQRLVKEGTIVKAGNVIAKMGKRKTTAARLHFQIRKNGKPVDPLKYLPKR